MGASMRHCLATWIVLAALAAPLVGEAAPPAIEGDLALLGCETVDRAACPALEGAFADRERVTKALVKWLATAKASDATWLSRAAVGLALLGTKAEATAMLAAAERLPANAEARVDLQAAAARVGEQKAGDALIITLNKGSDRGRVIAAGALGLLKKRAAIPALIAALKDTSRLRLQAAAAHALGLIGDDQAIAPLIAVAGQAKVFAPARIRSLDALAAFRARAAVPLATQLVDHPERDVGRAALRLLTAVPSRLAEPAVAFALKTPLLRGQAARAAVAMETSGLGPLVLKAAVAPGLTEDERVWVLHALGVFPPTGTADKLMDRYKSAGTKERIALLKAMPGVGDRTIIPRLVEALEGGEGEVVNYAVYALENLTGKRYGADLHAWRKFVGEAAKAAPSGTDAPPQGP